MRKSERSQTDKATSFSKDRSSDGRGNDRTLKIDGEVHVLANVGDQGGMRWWTCVQ